MVNIPHRLIAPSPSSPPLLSVSEWESHKETAPRPFRAVASNSPLARPAGERLTAAEVSRARKEASRLRWSRSLTPILPNTGIRKTRHTYECFFFCISLFHSFGPLSFLFIVCLDGVCFAHVFSSPWSQRRYTSATFRHSNPLYAPPTSGPT